MNDQKRPVNVTEPSNLFVKYKVPAIILIIILLLIPIGFGGYLHMKGEKEEAFGEKIFNFNKEQMSALKENKLKPSEFVSQFKTLLEETEYFKANFPMLIEAVDVLVNQNSLNQAREVLVLGDEKFSGENEYTRILIISRLSSLYEDMGETDKSITLLEDLLTSNNKILEGKIYLDLGRFYLKKGDKGKARDKFLYVLNNFDDENYKKLARLYMSKL